MPDVDQTYRQLVAGLPASLRSFARTAPHRLGLTTSSRGGWGTFVRIPPNRDLVSYAAEDLDLPAAVLERWAIAHQAAGFFGIVADRLSDGQVAMDARWAWLRRELLRAWERSLTVAAGDRARARAVVAAALAEWRRGRAIERSALRAGRFEDRYGLVIRLKLGWISSTARCMLEVAGHGARAALLGKVYYLFLCALQCRDDVVDREEDRWLQGSDVPAALGVEAGAMVRAAAMLLVVAGRAAREGGFHRLADWLGGFAARCDVFLTGGVALRDEIAGMALAAGIADERR